MTNPMHAVIIVGGGMNPDVDLSTRRGATLSFRHATRTSSEWAHMKLIRGCPSGVCRDNHTGGLNMQLLRLTMCFALVVTTYGQTHMPAARASAISEGEQAVADQLISLEKSTWELWKARDKARF